MAKTEWRECRFGAPAETSQGVRICQHIRARAEWVSPANCAACPVPVFVEAVRAADEYHQKLLVIDQAVDREGVGNVEVALLRDAAALLETANAKRQAALALLPEPEKGDEDGRKD